MILHFHNKEGEYVSSTEEAKDIKLDKNLVTFDRTIEFKLSNDMVDELKLENEGYITTPQNQFVIKEIKDSSKGDKTIFGNLNIEEIEGLSFEEFTTQEINVEQTLAKLCNTIKWSVVMKQSVTKRRTVKMTNSSGWEILKKIASTFRVEFDINAKDRTIYVYEKMGSNRGVYFFEELNAVSIKVTSDSHDFYTRIIPIGKEGLTIEDINGGKKYLENLSYASKVKTIIWKDERYTIPENLRDDAKLKLDDYCRPQTSLEIEFKDLAKLSDEFSYLEYGLGDEVTIIKNGTKYVDRIMTLEEYPDKPMSNKGQIAHIVPEFTEIDEMVVEVTQTVDNITEDNGTISTQAVKFAVGILTADKVNTTQLNAAMAEIGSLIANKVDVQDLIAINATIENLKANKADIDDLKATNADIKILKADSATIQQLLAGNITAGNISAELMQVINGWMMNGSIGNAQISELDAGKIKSGSIDTSFVTIVSKDSAIQITGNQLMINDVTDPLNPINRITIGKVIKTDGSIDYGMLIRGKDGKTIMFDSETGVTNAGITDGAVSNNQIADDANIQGYKLDINSVIRQVNENGQVTINGTKVQIGDRTLDVALTQQTETINEHTKLIDQQGTQIKANQQAIDLKVSSQTYLTDKQQMEQNINQISETSQSASLKVNEMIADNKFTPNEKFEVNREVSRIKVTKVQLTNSANLYPELATDLATYDTAYTNLLNYIEPMISPSMIGKTSDIDAAVYSAKFNDYYTQEQNLSGKIIQRAKDKVDTAQNVANSAHSAATEAKKQASLASADLANLANPNKLTPSEKQTYNKQFKEISSQYLKLKESADKYNLGSVTTNLVNAFNNLNTYTQPLFADMTTTSDIVAQTFVQKFQDYYTNSQLVMDAINQVIKNQSDTANQNAEQAKTDAQTANTKLQDVLSDSRITPIEKRDLLLSVNEIIKEKDGIISQAHTYGIPSGDYNTAFVVLNDYLFNTTDGILSNMEVTSDVDSQTTQNKFAYYYTTRQVVLDAIANKGKELSTNAQNAANAAKTDAQNATNKLNDMASNNKLTPVEKLNLDTIGQEILKEYPSIIRQANVYGINTSSYTNNYNQLNAYLYNSSAGILANLTTTTDIDRTRFTDNFNSYYDSRQSVLDQIATKSKEASNQALVDAKSYTNSQVSIVTQQLGTTNSAVQVLQQQISAAVTKTEMTETIGNIKFGGRNLVLNSNLLKFGNNNIGSGTSTLQSDDTGKFYRAMPDVGKTVSLYYYCKGNNVSEQLVTDSKTLYSMSLDVRVPKNSVITRFNFENEKWEKVTLLKDKWTRIKLEGFTLPSTTNKALIIALDTSIDVYLDYRNLKIENGTKSTDWTPAPEDFDKKITDSIDFTEKKISDMKSAIDIELGAITQTVSANTSNITTVTTTANAANSKIDNLEIGTRNYFINGDFSKPIIEGTGTGTIVDVTGNGAEKVPFKKCLYLTNQQGISHYKLIPALSSIPNSIKGKKVAISFWAKFKNVTQGPNDWNRLRFGELDIFGDNNYAWYPGVLSTLGTNETWTKYTGFIDLGGCKENLTSMNAKFLLEGTASGEAWVTGIQYEVGNKITDWKPAKEDVDQGITEADKKAQSAQSTASQANSTANTADSNANAAKGQAQTALNTANSANSKVDGMQIGTENILLNTGMYENYDYFSPSDGITRVPQADASLDGKCHTWLYNISGVTSDQWRSSNPSPQSIIGGEKYSGQARVFIPQNDHRLDNGNNRCYLELQFYDTAGNRIANPGTLIDINTCPKSKWFVVKYEGYTAPPNATKANCRVWVQRNGHLWVAQLKLERGTKCSDWSSSSYDAQLGIDKVTTTVTDTRNQLAQVKTELSGVTTTVSDHTNRLTTIDGKVTNQESRLQTAEQKITSTAIINSVSEALNNGQSVQSAGTKLDKNGFYVSQGQYDIKMSNGYITMYDNGVKAGYFGQDKVGLCDWIENTGKDIGQIYSSKETQTGRKGIGMATADDSAYLTLSILNTKPDIDGKFLQRVNLDNKGLAIFTDIDLNNYELKRVNQLNFEWYKAGVDKDWGKIYLKRHDNGISNFCVYGGDDKNDSVSLGVALADGSYYTNFSASYNEINCYANLNVGGYQMTKVAKVNYSLWDDVYIDRVNICGNQLNVNHESGWMWLNGWRGPIANGASDMRVAVGQGNNDGKYGKVTLGDLDTRGSKNSVIPTSQGLTKINAYETAGYYSGDIGETIIAEDGYAYVTFDPIFAETINTDYKYQVFTEVYGDENEWARVIKREKTHFVIKGTPGTEVGYEVKAKRRGYEMDRLDVIQADSPYEHSSQTIKTMTDLDNEIVNNSEISVSSNLKEMRGIERNINDEVDKHLNTNYNQSIVISNVSDDLDQANKLYEQLMGGI